MSLTVGERPAEEPSEWAADMCDLISDYPLEALRDLRELLGLELSAPPPRAQRQQMLGLLLRMIAADGSGQFISFAAYQEAKRDAQEAGEEWPDASTLSRAFGSWTQALLAAMNLYFVRVSRTGANRRYARQHPDDYSKEELVAALTKAAVSMGYWLGSETEWSRYARVMRMLHARQGAGGDPRIPTLAPFRRFGGFSSVLRDARQAAAEA